MIVNIFHAYFSRVLIAQKFLLNPLGLFSLVILKFGRYDLGMMSG